MIEFGHLTHVGLRRDLNEDTYYGDSELGLWLVADGMGGHPQGEVAAQLALQTVSALFQRQAKPALQDPQKFLSAALLAALPERATEKRLPTIPGVVPGQFDRPHGCLFSPRCSFADARCIAERPRPAGADLGYALCHYPLIDGLPTGKETAA